MNSENRRHNLVLGHTHPFPADMISDHYNIFIKIIDICNFNVEKVFKEIIEFKNIKKNFNSKLNKYYLMGIIRIFTATPTALVNIVNNCECTIYYKYD